jgi:hypothetical protein
MMMIFWAVPFIFITAKSHTPASRGLYLTTQNAQTHMSPCLVAVFLVGLFWPRANGKGLADCITAESRGKKPIDMDK